jgi:hypothetical protein
MSGYCTSGIPNEFGVLRLTQSQFIRAIAQQLRIPERLSKWKSPSRHLCNTLHVLNVHDVAPAFHQDHIPPNAV